MTLSLNDVSGARQEPYVLIPLGARDRDPGFWGWPGSYLSLPTGHEEFRIGLNDLGHPSTARIYFVPERSEFRLCAEEVYKLGPDYQGCLLVVTKTARAYRTEVVCEGDEEYEFITIHLTSEVPGGTKRWGYA